MGEKKIPIDFYQCAIYIFLTISSLLLLFPLFYAVSLSFQDANAIYRGELQFIPRLGSNVHIQIEANDVDEDGLKQLSAIALFGAYFETRNQEIDKYTVSIYQDKREVFTSKAHTMLLQLENDYGAYKSSMLSRDVILSKNRYNLAMDTIGYHYKPEGTDNRTSEESTDKKLSDFITDMLSSRYGLDVNALQVRIGKSGILEKLENYIYYFKLPQYIFKDYPFVAKYGFFAFMFNTILTVIVATVCQISLPAITAYPLAVLFKRKTANLLMNFFLITMMIPFVCIMIPQLVLLKGFGMYDNYQVMLFTWLLPSPFFIFLYKGFFEKIPKYYFEAAKIDGANEIFIFTRICLPLCAPIISLIAIQSFISGWTDFFWYYISTKKISLWTLNLAMYNINAMPSAKANSIMGLSVCIMLPVIIFALVFSKQIKQSVMSSGVKE